MIIFLNMKEFLQSNGVRQKKKKKANTIKSTMYYKYKSYKYKTMLIGNLRNTIQRMMKYYFSNVTFSNNKELNNQ